MSSTSGVTWTTLRHGSTSVFHCTPVEWPLISCWRNASTRKPSLCVAPAATESCTNSNASATRGARFSNSLSFYLRSTCVWHIAPIKRTIWTTVEPMLRNRIKDSTAWTLSTRIACYERKSLATRWCRNDLNPKIARPRIDF